MMKRFTPLAIAWACLASAVAAHAQQDWDFDSAWEAPSDYYSTAVGLTGTALRDRVHLIIEKDYFGNAADFSSVSNINLHGQHRVNDYGDAGPALDVLDQAIPRAGEFDFPQLNYVYDNINLLITQTTTRNREHVWSSARQQTGTQRGADSETDYADLYNLRWADGTTNSQKSARNFDDGTVISPSNMQQDGAGVVAGGTWYPGDGHRGDIARISFYMDVRYDGADSNTADLALVNGDPSFSTHTMGDLASMLEWHYEDPVDGWELRRNDHIFKRSYLDEFGNSETPVSWVTQGNRNFSVDRPEYVWSIFVDNANDTQLNVGGSPASDGSSSVSVDLGRIMQGEDFGTSSVTINKTGADGTYYQISASSNASAEDGGEDATGRYNAFEMGGGGSRSIDVGLGGANTNGVGNKTGTVTIDNLDVTTGGGTGKGDHDGDDVINVSGRVVSDRVISATTVDVGSFITGGTGTGTTTLSTTGGLNRTFVTLNDVNVANGTASVDVDSMLFDDSADTDTAGVSTSTTNVGDNSQTVTLTQANGAITGEGLTGESVHSIDVVIESTVLDHANASFASGSDVNVLSFDFGVLQPNTGTITEPAGLYNLVDTPGFTAALDLDAIAGQTAALDTDLSMFSDLAAGSSQMFDLRFDTTQPAGAYSTAITLTLSDEDLPGEATGVTLTINLQGIVAIEGDANLDGVVDATDLDILVANYGQSGTWAEADFNVDGMVDYLDLSLMGDAFGTDFTSLAPALAALTTAVPEPTSVALLALGGAMILCRRTSAMRSQS